MGGGICLGMSPGKVRTGMSLVRVVKGWGQVFLRWVSSLGWSLGHWGWRWSRTLGGLDSLKLGFLVEMRFAGRGILEVYLLGGLLS